MTISRCNAKQIQPVVVDAVKDTGKAVAITTLCVATALGIAWTWNMSSDKDILPSALSKTLGIAAGILVPSRTAFRYTESKLKAFYQSFKARLFSSKQDKENIKTQKKIEMTKDIAAFILGSAGVVSAIMASGFNNHSFELLSASFVSTGIAASALMTLAKSFKAKDVLAPIGAALGLGVTKFALICMDSKCDNQVEKCFVGSNLRNPLYAAAFILGGTFLMSLGRQKEKKV